MIGICFMVIGIYGLLTLWQLNNFGKRLKKLENEVKKINNPYNLDL